MNIVIFDTETIGVDKLFCYNIGYAICDTESGQVLTSHDFIVEQVWHNPMLFSTAYYAEKRPIYIKAMRSRKTAMEKYGYIMQFMIREFKAFDVQGAYAYNSDFDERVFNFNCEWFKTANPFDNIPIFDIRAYAFKKIAFTKIYQDYCDKHSHYTESGNYSTTAENIYRFITDNETFKEDHTALSDSLIEHCILQHCINLGCEWNTTYKAYKSVPKKEKKTLIVRTIDGEEFSYPYKKAIDYKEKKGIKKIILKGDC